MVGLDRTHSPLNLGEFCAIGTQGSKRKSKPKKLPAVEFDRLNSMLEARDLPKIPSNSGFIFCSGMSITHSFRMYLISVLIV